MSLGIRFLDIILSLVGLIILFFFLPLIWIFLRLDSKGPLFYMADRVGKNLKIFKMYKFRTMIETSVSVGQSVCPQYDPRVTDFGRILRRTKINELPQMINILKGEMSFVGPRPEAPDLAELYPDECKKIFTVQPGVVSPATLLYRNEEEMYPVGVDSKEYYINHILPEKLKIDLKYIENASVWAAIKIIMIGVKETLFGCISRKHLHDNRTQIYLAITDGMLVMASYIFSYSIYYFYNTGEIRVLECLRYLPLVLLTRSACNIFYGFYSHLIRYISYHEVIDVLKGAGAGTILLIIIEFLFKMGSYGSYIAAIDFSCLAALLASYRILLRIYREMAIRQVKALPKRRILIYGVCDEGNSAYRALTFDKKSPFEVVGFIDESMSTYGKVLNGKKVLGNRSHLKDLFKIYKVDELLVAAPIANAAVFSDLQRICRDANVKMLAFSKPSYPNFNGQYIHPFRNVSVTDVLPLENYISRRDEVREAVKGKTVLINGSGDSLGLEICRRLLQLGCTRLIVIERYEAYLNEMMHTLYTEFDSRSIIPCVVDSDRDDDIQGIFETYRPDAVIHASMRKYFSPYSVDVSNVGQMNYQRTFQLANAAARHQTSVFLMISSLEASIKGKFLNESLRVAEVSLHYFFSETRCRFVIARLCDIAENKGGIVANLDRQIRNRETVTLPSRSSRASLISNRSAADFVLEAMKEGMHKNLRKALFVCHQGTSVLLFDIATQIALLYGFEPLKDFHLIFSDESASVSGKVASSWQEPASRERPGENGVVDVGPEELQRIFKQFVTMNSISKRPTEWKAETDELIRLCDEEMVLTN